MPNEFEILKNDPKNIIVYRGVKNKTYADALKKVRFIFGGRKNNSKYLCMGSGIYTSPARKNAEDFTYSYVEVVNDNGQKNYESRQTGEVV